MWLRAFMPILASEVAQACALGHPITHVAPRGYDLEMRVAGAHGRLHVDYRYPQKHFLVQVNFYRSKRITTSCVRRFTLPPATLMALKMGSSGEKALRRLACEVVDWLEVCDEG